PPTVDSAINSDLSDPDGSSSPNSELSKAKDNPLASPPQGKHGVYGFPDPKGAASIGAGSPSPNFHLEPGGPQGTQWPASEASAAIARVGILGRSCLCGPTRHGRASGNPPITPAAPRLTAAGRRGPGQQWSYPHARGGRPSVGVVSRCFHVGLPCQ